MPRTVEQSRATALLAYEYVKDFKLQSTTNAKFGDITPERQRSLFFRLAEMRQAVADTSLISLGINKDADSFDLAVAYSREINIGNCGENACLALDYITRNEDGAYAEVYQMDEAVDHVFCVVDRKKGSDPMKPETWGANAYVCDPWGGEVYPASELTHSRIYQGTEVIHKPKQDDPWNIDVKKIEVTFDPSKHIIEPQNNLNTDFIREARSTRHVDSIIDAYRQKSQVVLSALKTFSEDLKKAVQRLDKDSTTGQVKVAVLRDKIEKVQCEIDRVQQEVHSNMPTRNDYFEVRRKLEGDLMTSVRNARIIMQFNPKEGAVLSQHKNPRLDKLLNKSTTETQKTVNGAIINAHAALNKLSDVSPKQVVPEVSSSTTPVSASSKEVTMSMRAEMSKMRLNASAKNEDPLADERGFVPKTP